MLNLVRDVKYIFRYYSRSKIHIHRDSTFIYYSKEPTLSSDGWSIKHRNLYSHLYAALTKGNINAGFGERK